jgi:hypothetical protein
MKKRGAVRASRVFECSEKLLVESRRSHVLAQSKSFTIENVATESCYNQIRVPDTEWILNADGLIKKNGETTNTLSFSDEWAV